MGNDVSKSGHHREQLRGEKARNDDGDSKRLHGLPGRDEAQQELVRRAVAAKRKEKAEKKAKSGGAQEFLKTHFRRPPANGTGGGGNRRRTPAATAVRTPKATTSKRDDNESAFKDKDASSIISAKKLGRDRSQSIDGSHKSSTLENGAAKSSSKKERLDQKVNDWLNNETNLWTFHDVSPEVMIARNQATGEAPAVYAFRQDHHFPYLHPHTVYPNDVSATPPRSHSIGDQQQQQQQAVYAAAYQPFVYHPYFTHYLPQFYHHNSPHYPPIHHHNQLVPFLSPQLARGGSRQQTGESRSKSQNNLADSGNGRGNSDDISAHSDTALPKQQHRKAKLMSVGGAVSDDLATQQRGFGGDVVTCDSIDRIHQQSSRSLHHSLTTYHDSSLTNSTTCNDVMFDDVRPDNSSSTSTGNNHCGNPTVDGGEAPAPAKAVGLPMMKLRESQSIVATSFQTSSGKFFCLTRSKSSSVNHRTTTSETTTTQVKEDGGDETREQVEVVDEISSLASTLESEDSSEKSSEEHTSEENGDTKVASDDEVEEGSSSSEEEVEARKSPPIPRPRSSLAIPSTLTPLAEHNNDDTRLQATSSTDDSSTEVDKQQDDDVRQEINDMESELMEKRRMFMSLSSTTTTTDQAMMQQQQQQPTLHKQLSESKREQSEDLLKRVNHILNGKSEFVSGSSSGGSEASWMMRNSTTTHHQQQHHIQAAAGESIDHHGDDLDDTSPTYRSTFNYQINSSPTKELQPTAVEVELRPTSEHRRVAPRRQLEGGETLEERTARVLGRTARHPSTPHQQKVAAAAAASSTSSEGCGEMQSYAPYRASTEYKLPNDVLRRDVIKSPTHSAPGRESIVASFAMTDQLYARSPTTTTTTTTTTNGSVRFDDDGDSGDESGGGDQNRKFSTNRMVAAHQKNGVGRSYKDQLNAVADAVGFNQSHRVREFQHTSSRHQAEVVVDSSTSSNSDVIQQQQSHRVVNNHHHHHHQMTRHETSSTSRGSSQQPVQSESQVREVMESLGLNPDESWMVSL